MPRLAFSGLPHAYEGSLEGTENVWRPGEERDVPDATARYLLDTFPHAFAETPPPDADAQRAPVPDAEPPPEGVAEALEAPDADRAMRSPPRRRGK